MTETEKDIAILEVQVPKAKLSAGAERQQGRASTHPAYPLDMKKFPGALTLVPGQAEFILNLWEWLKSKKDNVVPIKSLFLQYEITRGEFLPPPFQIKILTPKILIWSYWKLSGSRNIRPHCEGLMLGFPWHCVLSCMSSMVAAIFFFSVPQQAWMFGGEEKQKEASVKMQV